MLNHDTRTMILMFAREHGIDVFDCASFIDDVLLQVLMSYQQAQDTVPTVYGIRQQPRPEELL